MKKHIYTFAVLFLFSCQCQGQETRKYMVWQWNQTNKEMPQGVKDSICGFFRENHRDSIPFTLWGEGISEVKDSIDGIYQFRLFLTNQPKHLLIIYHSHIYIIKSIGASGFIAEMCRFIVDNAPERNFAQELFRVFYNSLFEEYEGLIKENDKYQTVSFANEKEKLEFLWSKSRKKEVLNIAKKITEKKVVAIDFPYYILTKNLNDEEIILVLGMIANCNIPNFSDQYIN